jgi:hypothetical protein
MLAEANQIVTILNPHFTSSAGSTTLNLNLSRQSRHQSCFEEAVAKSQSQRFDQMYWLLFFMSLRSVDSEKDSLFAR